MGRPPRASTSGKACATKSGGWRNRCAPFLGVCRRERHTLPAQRHFPDELRERTGEHGMTAVIFRVVFQKWRWLLLYSENPVLKAETKLLKRYTRRARDAR